jgi:hypothetical protein
LHNSFPVLLLLTKDEEWPPNAIVRRASSPSPPVAIVSSFEVPVVDGVRSVVEVFTCKLLLAAKSLGCCVMPFEEEEGWGRRAGSCVKGFVLVSEQPAPNSSAFFKRGGSISAEESCKY